MYNKNLQKLPVTEFNYLSSYITPYTNKGTKIQRRLILSNKCLHELSELLKSWMLSRATKINIYFTLILPMVRMGRSMDYQQNWHVETNGIWKKYDEETLWVDKNLKPHELWTRTIWQKYNWNNRINNRRMVHQVLFKTPLWKRAPGSPKLWGLDNVTDDPKKLSTTSWKAKTWDQHWVVE